MSRVVVSRDECNDIDEELLDDDELLEEITFSCELLFNVLKRRLTVFVV